MRDRPTSLSIFVLSLLCLGLTVPVSAQQVSIQNGATLRMSNGGVWHLQGATMDFGDVGATARLNEEARGRVTGGLLTATRALNSPSSVNVAGLGAEISASADLGAVAVRRGHDKQTLLDSSTSIRRFYDLSPSKSNRGLRGTLTYHYADAELDSLSEPSLELFKSDDSGSTWRPKGADSRDTTANTVTVSQIHSFSRWTLGPSQRAAVGLQSERPRKSPASSVRPGAGRLTLASVEADVTKDGAVRLSWEPDSGQSGDFRVERYPGSARQAEAATRGHEEGWTTISDGTQAVTKSDPTAYQFVDRALPYAADTLSYRIKRVGTDGKVQYSEPVAVARNGPQTLQLKAPFPNPARSHVTVRYAVPKGEESPEVTLRLYDIMGREVKVAEAESDVGWHETRLSVRDLATGVYLLRLQASGNLRTERLTVVR